MLLVAHYVIIYYHVITGINNDECHVVGKAANISKRSVQIWPAIVPAGHFIGTPGWPLTPFVPNGRKTRSRSATTVWSTEQTKIIDPELEELDKMYLTAMNITDDKQKRALLLYQAGRETQEIF